MQDEQVLARRAANTERRQRDRKSKKIREDNDLGVLLHSAMSVLKELGYVNAAKVLKHIAKDPEGVGDSLANFLDNPPAPPVEKLKPLEGLGFMLHHEMSKFDIQSVKKVSKACNADFLPCYDYISQAKVSCRPPRGKKHSIKNTFGLNDNFF